jgi:opine dehydrogenase
VDNFKLFYEGLTPSVMKVVNAMAREREGICTAFGWKSLIRAKEKSEMTGDDWFSTSRPKKGADAIRRTKMPIEEVSKDRYIHEDIPYGLVTCSSLGKLVNSATPTIDSIIHLASRITNKDFQAEGRTLEKLGLSGLSLQQINSFLYSGEKG